VQQVERHGRREQPRLHVEDHAAEAAEAADSRADAHPAARLAQGAQEVAKGVVTQTLLPRARGGGRVVACEIMVCTPAVRACIRDDKIHQIYSIMQAGKKFGMQTLNDSLYQLYMQSEVSLEDCLQFSSDPNEFLRMAGKSMPS
jgi:twitching motility protein PilT